MELRRLPGSPESARPFSWSDVLGEPEKPPRARRTPAISSVLLAALIAVVLALSLGARPDEERAADARATEYLWRTRYGLLQHALESYSAALDTPLLGLAAQCRQRADREADAVLFCVLWLLDEKSPRRARAIRACRGRDFDAERFPTTAKLLAELRS